MKLVFQIAGGILLSVIVLWGMWAATMMYIAKHANDYAEAVKQQQIQRQQQLARLQAERRARQQAYNAEQQRRQQLLAEELRRQRQLADETRRKAAQLAARKRAAFNEWWQPPEWCKRATNMKMAMQCGELKNTKRAEFEKLLAAGKLTLPTKM